MKRQRLEKAKAVKDDTFKSVLNRQIEAKFFKLAELIHELDDLSFETKDQFKKKFDVEFKTYYTGVN